MREAKAYCPGSIGFIFKACPNQNLLKMGSVGVGTTVDQGTTVSVQKSTRTEIFFNQKPICFPTVLTVIKALTDKPVKVSILSPLPLGFGFGLSSASALATSYAINQLLYLSKTEKELIEIVHKAEIIHKTGLGSVGTQTTGGFLLKTAPGLPVVAISLPFENRKIYAIIIKPLLTPTILKDEKKLSKINMMADQKLKEIQKLSSPTLADILDISYEYIKKCNFLDNREVTGIIEKIKKNGGHATMAILGYVVFSSQPPVDARYNIKTLTITKSKVTTVLS